MKKVSVFGLIAIAALSVTTVQAEQDCSQELLTRFWYSTGFDVGKQIPEAVADLSVPRYLHGLSDALGGNSGGKKLSPEEMESALAKYRSERDSADAISRETNMDVSYVYGFRAGEGTYKKMFSDSFFSANSFSADAYVSGISDGLRGEGAPLSSEEVEGVYTVCARELLAQYEETNLARALTRSKAFLAENEKKNHVFTRTSGLQYQILEASGNGGPNPTTKDVVEAHLHGETVAGDVFVSTVESGKAVVGALSDFPIEGLREAISLMSVGDKWRVFIPPDLAFGEMGTGSVGPNEVVIFEIELLGIE